MIDFDIVLHPKETAIAHAKKADVKEAAIAYAFWGFIFFGFISLMPIICPSSKYSSACFENFKIENWIRDWSMIISHMIIWGIIGAIAAVIIGFIGWKIFQLVANATKNKCDYAKNVHVGSRMFGPMILISLVVLYIARANFQIALPIMVIWFLYNAYMHIAAAAGTNKISMSKAFGLVLATFVLLGVLLWILAQVIIWYLSMLFTTIYTTR